MSAIYASLLKKYLQLPERLEAAIAGLSETDLDLTKGAGWPIRAYVHHTVEGELIWQLFLRAIIGRDGIEIPIAWYFGLEQEEWGRRWAYDKALSNRPWPFSAPAPVPWPNSCAPSLWKHGNILGMHLAR